jgi:hypothetical protein
LAGALVRTADRQIWARYCRLAAKIEGGYAAAAPVFAVGSVEWQRQQDQPPSPREGASLTADEQAFGRQRLAQRGAAPVFSGAPSPLGAASRAAFDDFVARHRGPPALLAEIEAVEQQLVDGFVAAGRAGRYRVSGFRDGVKREIEPEWLGTAQLDFANNRVVLPDGVETAAIEVTVEPGAMAGDAARERPARAMLRQALVALWERGAFTAGTGNERVLALALRELGLSPSDPPYGFKSAETVRKLRKALKMSL